MPPIVQSVLLRKEKFSLDEAKDWILNHGYKLVKVDTTPEYYRFRQMDPKHLEILGYRARTQPLGDVGHLILFYQ